MSMTTIPYHVPYLTQREGVYIQEAFNNKKLSGNGPMTKKAESLLEAHTQSHKVLLTHSCTAALEMSAILADIQPGDEIIVPSYTFVSTVNAFALRGAVPVFVDVRDDTLNIDETLIEVAITSKTKAIVPVHYAGVSCEMHTINAIAQKNKLMVIEDAAQGVGAFYYGKALGTLGELGCLSFHDTKNIISGEGGALLINDPSLKERAEIIREKGTDRSRFVRGEVDKYTWQDIGSSYIPSEMIAAFLLAQLESMEAITQARLDIWAYYHEALKPLEETGLIRRPIVPNGCDHNAHIYYVLLSDELNVDEVYDAIREQGVQCMSHYAPLHLSPMAQKIGRVSGDIHVATHHAEKILRLPLWVGMTEAQQERVVVAVCDAMMAARQASRSDCTIK